jgi:hypothetical protein
LIDVHIEIELGEMLGAAPDSWERGATVFLDAYFQAGRDGSEDVGVGLFDGASADGVGTGRRGPSTFFDDRRQESHFPASLATSSTSTRRST